MTGGTQTFQALGAVNAWNAAILSASYIDQHKAFGTEEPHEPVDELEEQEKCLLCAALGAKERIALRRQETPSADG
jgi:hypothetical protein